MIVGKWIVSSKKSGELYKICCPGGQVLDSSNIIYEPVTSAADATKFDSKEDIPDFIKSNRKMAIINLYYDDGIEDDGSEDDEADSNGDESYEITDAGKRYLELSNAEKQLCSIPLKKWESLDLELDQETINRLEDLANELNRDIDSIISEVLQNAISERIEWSDTVALRKAIDARKPAILTCMTENGEEPIAKVTPL